MFRQWREKAIERQHRRQAFNFSKGLDLLTAEQPLIDNDHWGKREIIVDFDPRLKIESVRTGMMYREPREPVLDVYVYIEQADDWILIFHQYGTFTRRFNYGREWVTHLWNVIHSEQSYQSKVARKEKDERYSPL